MPTLDPLRALVLAAGGLIGGLALAMTHTRIRGRTVLGRPLKLLQQAFSGWMSTMPVWVHFAFLPAVLGLYLGGLFLAFQLTGLYDGRPWTAEGATWDLVIVSLLASATNTWLKYRS
jgi:hypothetical protein